MKQNELEKKHGLLGSYTHRHNLIGFCFAIPAIIFLLVFVLYPVLYNVVLSFTDASLSAKKATHFIGLKNYLKMFSNRLFHCCMICSGRQRTASL